MCANPIQTNTAHVFQTMLRIVSLGFETSIEHLHHFLIGPNLVLMCHTLRIRSRSSPTPWSYLPRVIYPWQSRHTQYSNSPCASPLVIYLATLRVDTPSTLIAHVSTIQPPQFSVALHNSAPSILWCNTPNTFPPFFKTVRSIVLLAWCIFTFVCNQWLRPISA